MAVDQSKACIWGYVSQKNECSVLTCRLHDWMLKYVTASTT